MGDDMVNQVLVAFARVSVAACVAFAFSAAGQAADNFRYLSSTGSNANPCTLAQPCRSLQATINKTPVGGELRILDSGFFGNNANISRSITISGNGNTITLGAPITINDAGATVALRGLVLSGEGTTSDGIVVTTAAKVFIERCVVHGFAASGITIVGAADIFINDSTSRGNASSGLIVLEFGTTPIRLWVDNSRFESNGGVGIALQTGTASINRSVVSGNDRGIFIRGGPMNVTSTEVANNTIEGLLLDLGGKVTLESSVVRGNSVGLNIDDSSGTARIATSVFTDNVTGIRNFGGTVLTRGNNTVWGNTTQTTGTLTALGGL
jgi:Right handed beta helix region